MNALANAILGLVAAALLLTVGLPLATGTEAAMPTTATPVRFGMNASSVAAQKAAGVAPDYGTLWIGPWTLSSGWGGPDGEMAAMKAAGVTPAIHFYYWGDDISPSCVENGCWSSLHKAQKTRAGWEQLGTQLTQHLDSKMGGAPAVVFLESEFNKGGISTYEPFDGYMAAMARKIHEGYPNAQVVLGFGAWDSGNWHRFDQAAAASDIVGVQAMRGSTKDSATHYNDVYESTLSHVKKLQGLFGKPVMLTDLALSSYPEPSYLTTQAANLREIMDNLPALKAAGLRAVVYRSWADTNMDTANYYGEAERHWGLAYPGGAQKEAAKAWIAGVKAERAGTSAAPTTSAAAGTTTTAAAATTTTAAGTAASAGGLTASVTPSGNEWWVQAGVSAPKAIAKVEAKAGSAGYVTLEQKSYGWAKSFHVPKGTLVQFRVTATDGSTATTPAQAWLVDMGTKSATSGGTAATSTTTAAPATTTTAAASTATTTAAKSTTTTTTAAKTTTTASTTFTAKFTPTTVGNDYRVETTLSASQPVAKVEVKVGTGGSWVTMDKTSTGSYVKSTYAPNGTYVQFRATSSAGAVVASPTYVWG